MLATIPLTRKMITFIGGKQRCKQNALRQAKQSDEKGQSDAIAATIVEHHIIYILAFFLAFTFKITEIDQRKGLTKPQYKTFTAGCRHSPNIASPEYPRIPMMCICIYIHATAQAGENIK